jgi:hypothetical protein
MCRGVVIFRKYLALFHKYLAIPQIFGGPVLETILECEAVMLHGQKAR